MREPEPLLYVRLLPYGVACECGHQMATDAPELPLKDTVVKLFCHNKGCQHFDVRYRLSLPRATLRLA